MFHGFISVSNNLFAMKAKAGKNSKGWGRFGWVFPCASPKMCWRSYSASTEHLLVKKVACLRSFNKNKNQNQLSDLDLSLWVICRWIVLCLRTELIIHMSKMSRACFRVIQVSSHYRTTLKLPELRQHKTQDKLTPKNPATNPTVSPPALQACLALLRVRAEPYLKARAVPGNHGWSLEIVKK